jgi:hypothetical protein
VHRREIATRNYGQDDGLHAPIWERLEMQRAFTIIHIAGIKDIREKGKRSFHRLRRQGRDSDRNWSKAAATRELAGAFTTAQA